MLLIEYDACKIKPCMHGATCIKSGERDYLCNCTGNYAGRHCAGEFCVGHVQL